MQAFPDVGNLVATHREQPSRAREIGHDVVGADVTGIAVHARLARERGYGFGVRCESELQAEHQPGEYENAFDRGNHWLTPFVGEVDGNNRLLLPAIARPTRISREIAGAVAALATGACCSTVFR